MIEVGQIMRPHGVKGAVRLRSFMENPLDIFSQPCLDKTGKAWKLKLLFQDKNEFVVEIEGITDRDQADKLKNNFLFLSRENLPELPKDTYYQADIVGLEARKPDGEVIGKITAFHNFGAGDLIEVLGYADMIPFHEPYLISVHLDEGYVVIELPIYV
jgi:16S rRNA processing protein RimM